MVQRVHPGTVDQPTRDTRTFVLYIKLVKFRKSGHFLPLPERKDDNSRNHKDYGKHHKHGVGGPMPCGVVEYLCTLKNKNRNTSAKFSCVDAIFTTVLKLCLCQILF